MGRYAARWTGHSAYWRVMADMGFLEDEPLKFLVEHLTPRLQYRDNERDVAVLRIEAWGLKEGRKKMTYEVIDYRDLETGLFAMNRTVGFTASIAAQMILSGEVSRPGVLSPICRCPGRTGAGRTSAPKYPGGETGRGNARETMNRSSIPRRFRVGAMARGEDTGKKDRRHETPRFGLP